MATKELQILNVSLRIRWSSEKQIISIMSEIAWVLLNSDTTLLRSFEKQENIIILKQLSSQFLFAWSKETLNWCMSCFEILFQSPLFWFPWQFIILIFKVKNLPPSFHSKRRSRKTSTTPTESKKPRREGEEDSEISESDEVDTGAKCIALIPTRS